MADVTEPVFKARMLHDISVIFAEDASGGGVEFRDAVQSFQFVPSSTISTTKGGTPKSVWTDVGTATWQLNIKLLQDLESTTSLVNYLLQNAGLERVVRFVPNHGRAVTAVIKCAPPALGGDIDAWLDATISLPVNGAPAYLV